jgi:hypothetical protein
MHRSIDFDALDMATQSLYLLVKNAKANDSEYTDTRISLGFQLLYFLDSFHIRTGRKTRQLVFAFGHESY